MNAATLISSVTLAGVGLTIYLLWRNTMDNAELATALGGISDSLGTVGEQLAKATAEIITAIANSGGTTPEVDAAVAKLQGVSDALKTAAQTLDDLNADEVPTP